MKNQLGKSKLRWSRGARVLMLFLSILLNFSLLAQNDDYAIVTFKAPDSSEYLSYIRFKSDGRVINVWQNKDSSFAGEVLFYIEWLQKTPFRHEKDTIIRSYPIADTLAQDVYELYSTYSIKNIVDASNDQPSGSYVYGTPYIFEFYSPDTTVFKHFQKAPVQYNSPENGEVELFIGELLNLLNENRIYADFKSHIPLIGCVSVVSGNIECNNNSYLSLGVSSSLKYPLNVSLFNYIYATKWRYVGVGASLGYGADFSGGYTMHASVTRHFAGWDLFNKSVLATGMYRRETETEQGYLLELTTAAVGLGKSYFGISYKSSFDTKLGAYVSRSFNMRKINTYLSAGLYVFNNEIAGSVYLGKLFHIGKFSFNCGMVYEALEQKWDVAVLLSFPLISY